MSSLSAREQRILAEIEGDLAAAEPRLEQALVAAKLPALRACSVVRSDQAKLRRSWWIAGLLASLLCGFGLLTAGLVLNSLPLIVVGIPLAQFSPFIAGYRGIARASRTR
jgi:hypothetical protein